MKTNRQKNKAWETVLENFNSQFGNKKLLPQLKGVWKNENKQIKAYHTIYKRGSPQKVKVVNICQLTAVFTGHTFSYQQCKQFQQYCFQNWKIAQL
jgi:hypothetical protein